MFKFFMLIFFFSILFGSNISLAQSSKELAALAKIIPIADVHMHTYSRGGQSSAEFLNQMNKNNVRWGGAVGDYRSDAAEKLKERYIPSIGQIEFMEVFFSRGSSALTDEDNSIFKLLYKNADEQFANGTIKGFGELHTDNHSSGP